MHSFYRTRTGAHFFAPVRATLAGTELGPQPRHHRMETVTEVLPITSHRPLYCPEALWRNLPPISKVRHATAIPILWSG